MRALWPRAVLAAALSGSAAAGAAAPGAFDLDEALRVAEAGETVVVPPGVYAGPVVIDRTLELVTRGGAVIDGGDRGDVVKILAPGVTLRGFTIRGTGTSLDQENAGITVLAGDARIEDNTLEDVLFGIYLKDGRGSVIAGNRIASKSLDLGRRGDAVRLWHSPDCVIENNVVDRSRDVVIWFSSGVTLRHNRVTNGRYGLHFMYSDDNLIEENHLEGNSVGAFLMYSRNLLLRRNTFARNRGPSGYGIGLKDMDGVTAEDNQIIGNRIGIYLDNSPWSVNVYDHFRRNVLAHNDIGVSFQPAVKRNIFLENSFLENLEQIAVQGGGAFRGNVFTAEGRGNFWSDYTGYDLDEDDVGDLPYRSESLFENLMDREPKLRLFLFSPAQQAIDLAAHAFPAVRPKPKVTDTGPLMSLVVPDLPPPQGRPRWPLAALGGLLLVVCGLALGGGRRERIRPSDSIGATREGGRDDPPDSTMIEVTDLVKRFGSFSAVDRLSFRVGRGEAVALWGENGAGKTTAIRCILGLLRFEGRITVAGRDLRSAGKASRRATGHVPQELAFYDDWTPVETLAFLAGLRRVPRGRVLPTLQEVGLADHGRKRVASLSGGMKQRLALAAALLSDPPILILDEITSNLDTTARRDLLRLLQAQKRQGKTVLFTSHRLDEVESLADRIVVLEEGRRKLVCGPQELTEALKLRASLRLSIAHDRVERAVSTLLERGFRAQRNGSGLFVEVEPRDKAAPFRVLEKAGIAVRDFEIDNDPHPAPETDE